MNKLLLLLCLGVRCGTACSISVTSPANNATLSGPTTLSATTDCASAVRFEWRIFGMQPLYGDGTYENSYTVPNCNAGTCTGTYQMPNGFGPYNVSYLWDGNYPLTVLAEDASGAILATSAAINFTVNDFGFGTFCSISSPNLSMAQSGTITITAHCPFTGMTGVFANGFYTFTVDGKDIGDHFEFGYPDVPVTFDTTTVPDGPHLVAISVISSPNSGGLTGGGASPFTGVIGTLTTANGATAQELRMNFNKSYLWLGGAATVSLFARTRNTDGSEAATSATFVSDTPSVATIGSCTSVSACTITGIAAGIANITATAANGKSATTIVTVQSGTPKFPHLGYDGSVCTAYNSGNCTGGKSQITTSMFDNNQTIGGDVGLRGAMLSAGFKAFEHGFYWGPPQMAWGSYATWTGYQDGNNTNPINAALAAGFKSFVGRCEGFALSGADFAQSSADANTSDTGGFAARVAYLASKFNGKVAYCVRGDEWPYPLIRGNGTGQMGSVNGPTQIVVSTGTATVTWTAFHRAGYRVGITGATNTCFNSNGNIFTGTPDVGPFTFPTTCPNGTYNSSTDPNLTFQVFDEVSPCGANGCAAYATSPLGIPVPNSVLATITNQLQTAFNPPIQEDIPWQGGAGQTAYAIGATISGLADIYWTYNGVESNGAVNGLPNAKTIRGGLTSIENHFWNSAWPGIDQSKPFVLETSGQGNWYSRGGTTYTLAATTGSQFTTTTPNVARVGGIVTTRITVIGSTSCDGYYDVSSIQSNTTFTVSQSPNCTGSGGTVIIAPATLWYTPPMDRLKAPGQRAIELSAISWDCIILGCAGSRLYTLGKSSGQGDNFHNYPATAQNTYTNTNTPPNSPSNENNSTALYYDPSDSPSALERWNGVGMAQTLISALSPQIIQPMCNAPDFGPRVHTGARCGSAGKLVIAINDNEVPSTLTFPASLWGLYNGGTGPITRLQQIKAAYVNATNLAPSSTSDQFTADVGEVDLWWFPSGSVPLAQPVQVAFNPASVGATQTALRLSPICNPATFASNLDQQAVHIVFGSTTSIPLLKISGMPLCYDYLYLDNSNVPVGATSSVQVLP